ncbi:18S rRNA maturation protein [Lunasporangiospora selenospora]|uniref:rRNA-processing protein EFG1 n=1 Tax=Lunasporangiospora selenospora TaxID=979761 RepID=A0A9P6FZQ0_9FUNG|nr:18S rRNA maturation protein [Lunasporangiospora selenospora]
MPAPKKIVNPEKELRGKKPYKRGGTANGKKSFQAKPARLDNNEVLDSTTALNKKLRDTLRLLSKNPTMPANIRREHERRIEALKLQIAEKKVNQTEQKMATKYRMVKFFESKKADRKLKVFKRQHPDWETNENEKKEMKELELDLAYIEHYPASHKYISLYPNASDEPDSETNKQRQEIREKIRSGIESGEISQVVKAAREEVKAKIVSKNTTTEEDIKKTAEKISTSMKKRSLSQEQDDPLAARARATAERAAEKPVVEVEEESFFEAVTKDTSNSNKEKKQPETEGPAKKKAKLEKTPAKETTPKQQPKQKKEQKAEAPQAKAEKINSGSTESPAAGDDEQPKKLGKWAKKALRAQAVATNTDLTANDSSVPTLAGKDSTKSKKDTTKQKKEVAKVAESSESEKESQEESKVAEIAPKISVLKISHDAESSDSDSEAEEEAPVVPVRKVVAVDHSQLKELPPIPKKRGGRNQHKYRQ